MTSWLVSVKLALDKRSQKIGKLTTDNLTKIFSMGTDLTRAFEYMLATGNLISKSGIVNALSGRIPTDKV